MRKKSPTKDDRIEFAEFCWNASPLQLHEIYRREKFANRRVYAEIAKTEIEHRERRID